ncbi:MAG: hypothetical protein ACRDNS_17290 [Trebonia sp.]
MDDESVLQLIKGGESEQIERKEQLKSTTRVMRLGCRLLMNCSASYPTCGTTASSCPSPK